MRSKKFNSSRRNLGDRGRLFVPVLEMMGDRTRLPDDDQQSAGETPGTPAVLSDQTASEEGVIVYPSLEDSQIARANEARARISRVHEREDQPAEA